MVHVSNITAPPLGSRSRILSVVLHPASTIILNTRPLPATPRDATPTPSWPMRAQHWARPANQGPEVISGRQHQLLLCSILTPPATLGLMSQFESRRQSLGSQVHRSLQAGASVGTNGPDLKPNSGDRSLCFGPLLLGLTAVRSKTLASSLTDGSWEGSS